MTNGFVSFILGADFNLLPKNCGMSVSDRVSHGNATLVYEHPWMAVIRYTSKEKILDLCVGSLINERYVLTAGQCIRNKTLHSVILGEHTKSQDRDCNKFYDANGMLLEMDCAEAVEEFGIESFEHHAEYDRPAHSNDIGLLRLNRRVVMKDHIQPICLPITAELRRLTSSYFIAVGWGETKNDTTSDVLKEINQLRIDNEALKRYTTDIGSIFSWAASRCVLEMKMRTVRAEDLVVDRWASLPIMTDLDSYKSA
ncbi:hypothetical protein RP20_CCG022365 [Aedes albopictus]|nr:hypothetical protein RP20_CCG022365 [Aedes albopictus]